MRPPDGHLSTTIRVMISHRLPLPSPQVQWVQCDTCQRWRRVPDTLDATAFPENWWVELGSLAV
jgi:hypothetical protein